jgi:hypothetical protein
MTLLKLHLSARTISFGTPIVREQRLVLETPKSTLALVREYRAVSDERETLCSWRPTQRQIRCLRQAAMIAIGAGRQTSGMRQLERLDLPSVRRLQQQFRAWQKTYLASNVEVEGLYAVESLLRDPTAVEKAIVGLWLGGYEWSRGISTTMHLEQSRGDPVELWSHSAAPFHLPWHIRHGTTGEVSDVYTSRLSRLLGLGLPKDFITRRYLLGKRWEYDFFQNVAMGLRVHRSQ